MTFLKCKIGEKDGPEHLIAVLDKANPHCSLLLEFTRLDEKVWIYSTGASDVDVTGKQYVIMYNIVIWSLVLTCFSSNK